MFTKTCSQCGKTLPATLEYFYYHKNTRFETRSECKECSRLSTRVAYLKNRDQNREKTNSRSREYYRANKEKRRSYLIRKNFNTSERFIRDLMDKQKGCCAICGVSLVSPDSSKSFNVDHCHETGVIRGLLCHKCNVGIGMFQDNVDIIKNIITYLEDSRSSI